MLIYGTAWKEEKTAACVRAALAAGFRAIDTANQRRHYHEAGVGEAVREALAGGLKRQDLFLQTKFTYITGQDNRLPYDPKAAVSEQVKQSFARSLEHLGTDYIDSYVLHGPMLRVGVVDEDWEAWRAMETLQRSGRARSIGLSNVSLDQLVRFYEDAEVKPAAVQNRCYASTGWDENVRTFCRENKIAYQGFSLLTANVDSIQSPKVVAIARRLNKSLPQVVFKFALQVGMTPLTGTTNPEHMAQDLKLEDFELMLEDVRTLEEVAVA